MCYNINRLHLFSPPQDEDALTVYKIQSSHTIHMVKGAVRNAGSTSGAAPQALPTMQSGQNVHDPLTQLNGHQGYGLMAGLNPFADMGLNPNDPNMVSELLRLTGCDTDEKLLCRCKA